MLYNKKIAILLLFAWLLSPGAYAQDQKIADSLAVNYQQNTVTDTAKFDLLKKLAFNEVNDLNKAIKYAEELITGAEMAKNDLYLGVGYFIKGSKERVIGNYQDALEAFFKSAAIAKKTHQLQFEVQCYTAIADAYSGSGNQPKAINYYHQAISTFALPKNSIDSITYASVFLNVGDEYLKTKKYDSALWYSNRAKFIFDKAKHQSGIGYSLGNIGMVYANTGKNFPAEKNLQEAILVLEKAQDYYPICVYLLTLADLQYNKGDAYTAQNYATKSLHLAEDKGLKEQMVAAHLKLSELFEKSENYKSALSHYKTHLIYYV